MKQPRPIPEPPPCAHPHPTPPAVVTDMATVERAARLFGALGDPARLDLLLRLAAGECCVSELVSGSGEKFPTVSARLRILRTEGLVRKRRDGLHVYYALADAHVTQLITNALDHARELIGPPPATRPAAVSPPRPTPVTHPHSHPTEDER